jgi:uncharacterized protein YbjQ (UPF0145 family)
MIAAPNFLKDIMAGVTNFFGGRSGAKVYKLSKDA